MVRVHFWLLIGACLLVAVSLCVIPLIVIADDAAQEATNRCRASSFSILESALSTAKNASQTAESAASGAALPLGDNLLVSAAAAAVDTIRLSLEAYSAVLKAAAIQITRDKTNTAAYQNVTLSYHTADLSRRVFAQDVVATLTFAAGPRAAASAPSTASALVRSLPHTAVCGVAVFPFSSPGQSVVSVAPPGSPAAGPFPAVSGAGDPYVATQFAAADNITAGTWLPTGGSLQVSGSTAAAFVVPTLLAGVGSGAVEFGPPGAVPGGALTGEVSSRLYFGVGGAPGGGGIGLVLRTSVWADALTNATALLPSGSVAFVVWLDDAGAPASVIATSEPRAGDGGATAAAVTEAIGFLSRQATTGPLPGAGWFALESDRGVAANATSGAPGKNSSSRLWQRAGGNYSMVLFDGIAPAGVAAWAGRSVRLVMALPRAALLLTVTEVSQSLAGKVESARQNLSASIDAAVQLVADAGRLGRAWNIGVGVGVAVLSMVLCAGVVAAVTLPLAAVARAQQFAASFDVQGASDALMPSFVREIGALVDRFRSMLAALVEYRRFLPAALLADAAAEADAEADGAEVMRTAGGEGAQEAPHPPVAVIRPRRGSVRSQTSSAVGSERRSTAASASPAPPAPSAALDVSASVRRVVVVAVLALRPSGDVGGSAPGATAHHRWLSAILTAIDAAARKVAPSAAVQPAVAAEGSSALRVAICLNALHPCANAEVKALDIAVVLSRVLPPLCAGAGIGLAGTRCVVGAVGTAHARWLATFGPAGPLARAYAAVALRYIPPTSLSTPGQVRAFVHPSVLLPGGPSATFETRVVASAAVTGVGGMGERPEAVRQLLGQKNVAAEEWMYQLEEMEAQDVHQPCAAAVTAAVNGDFAGAEAALAPYLASRSDDEMAAELMARIRRGVGVEPAGLFRSTFALRTVASGADAVVDM